MIMKTKSLTLIVVILILFSGIKLNGQENSAISDSSQKANWRVFSPPDKSFTVELSDNPEHSNTLDPNDPDIYGMFKCTKSFDAYYINSKDYSISIIVFDVSGCRRTKKLFDKEAKILAEILGPDEKEIIKRANVKINNLPARDVIYTEVSGCGRNLIVNAGKLIFLLSYGSEKNTFLSQDIERIFRSFKPHQIK